MGVQLLEKRRLRGGARNLEHRGRLSSSRSDRVPTCPAFRRPARPAGSSEQHTLAFSFLRRTRRASTRGGGPTYTRASVSVVVQKYGGSSVADVERIRRVAVRVA